MNGAQRYAIRLRDFANGKSDGEYEDLNDYLDQTTLEIDDIINRSTGETVGVQVLLAYGGPGCYVDTYNQMVVYNSTSEVYTCGIDRRTAEAINEWAGI